MTRVLPCSSAVLAALLLGLFPVPALHAADRQQDIYATSPAQTPESSEDLGRYLSRLARDPRDVDTLVGAGEAALKLSDPRAAAEFFARADAIDPNNKRVKAGLARAMLGMENPAESLRLFREAVRLGAKDADIALDRGLALDLTGDPVSAQRDYKLVLDRDANNPEALRRYAVSLGISGKWQEADRIIDPLLRKSDKTAWRNRAFVLAMNGQSKQARDITQVMMPKNMAAAIQPFLDRMPGLTPAQRAAAVHFGHFPSGMVRSSQPAMVQPLPSAGTSRPVTQPKSRTVRRDKPPVPARSVPAQVAAATPVPRPVQPVAASIPSTLVQAPSGSEKRPPVQPVPAPARPAFVPAQAMTPQVAPPRAAGAVEDRIGPPAESNVGSSVALASSAPPKQDARNLAEIMREVSIPDAERAPAIVPVDLAEVARIQAEKRKAEQATAARAKAEAEARAKAKAEAEAKAKAKAEAALKAKNPARIWVQIATGRDTGALAFDMAKLRKKYPEALKGRDAWTSPWGATRRMVIGPFASASAAKSFYSDWMKAGGDGYIWQSTDGLEVEKLVEK